MTGVASPVLEAIADLRCEIEAATAGSIVVPWEEEQPASPTAPGHAT